MKTTFIALLGAAVAVAHEHGHQHLHARVAQEPDKAYEVVAGPTVIVYELNGQFITEHDVEEGVRNGSLVFAHGQIVPSAQAAPSTSAAPSSSWVAPTSAPPPPPSSSAAPTTSSVAPPPPPPSSSAAPQPSTSAAAAPSPSSSPSSSSSNSGSSISGGSGVDSAFPDGQLSCSHFPSDYGAISLDYLGLGGWTGVQSPGSALGGFANILTQTSSTCGNGGCCTEGSFCSYACPAGYQKAQWPSTQGATGQSVGGIQCLNGKLHLTNSALSNQLCIKGASQVNVEVVNNLGKNVAVCRTDYPGTESMTIPVDAQPGSTNPLTCPDSSTYYHWQGGSTSAQYYVNPAGVSVKDGCTWGSNANPWGNFAPLNLGVGYSGGNAWLSIFQNAPTTNAKLDFTVEIQGDNLSGSCKYSNGQYCGSTGCSSTTGCTVS